jgi:hypothetical protein
VIKQDVSSSMGVQALSNRKTAPRAGIFPDSVLGVERTQRLNQHIENIQVSPIKEGQGGSMGYSVGPTKSIDASGRPGVALSNAFLITNSTIGIESPVSDYSRQPTVTFSARPNETIAISPGPGAYQYDSYTTLSGDHVSKASIMLSVLTYICMVF